MTPEDEEFERIAMEAKLKQDHVRALSLDTYLKTVEELTVARMLIRELGDRLAKLEGERNFCQRCGKRLVDGSIHTCTPPLENV
jgi:hypothetical protein